MVAQVKVTGRERLSARLKAADDKLQAQARVAVVQGAEEVAAQMRAIVPIGETGRLEESIAVTRPGRTTPAYAANGGKRQAGEFEALVTAGDSDVRYAHLVEFGTRPHRQPKLGIDHPGAAAHPFFFVSYRLLRKRVASRIKRAMTAAIRKTAGL